MSDIRIPICEMQFSEHGNTIWFHSPLGGTVFRLKTLGHIVTEHCATSPISHADAIVAHDIKICLAPDSDPEEA